MSNPSFVVPIVPNPSKTFPATEDRGVMNTSGLLLKDVVNATCFDVCSLALGVMTTLPVWIFMPPKAEFCTQKEGDLCGDQIETSDSLILL